MIRIKDCYVQGNVDDRNVYITSGFQPPTDADLYKRANVSAHMQQFASGGSIDHVFLGGKVDVSLKKALIDKMFSTPMTYMTLSPIVSICKKCGNKMVGEHHKCTECDNEDEIIVYARVIGYVRPIVYGKIKEENGRIDGTENYWQDSRRVDWVERSKLYS